MDIDRSKVVPTQMSKLNPTIIFYAWQDDLPAASNKNSIRTGLKEATQSITGEFYLDEATRDTPGSPNIPQEILEKIPKADIFIADVTRITPDGAKKHCPNPNVTFELGVAARHLGCDLLP